jgi:hypothetical protein
MPNADVIGGKRVVCPVCLSDGKIMVPVQSKAAANTVTHKGSPDDLFKIERSDVRFKEVKRAFSSAVLAVVDRYEARRRGGRACRRR